MLPVVITARLMNFLSIIWVSKRAAVGVAIGEAGAVDSMLELTGAMALGASGNSLAADICTIANKASVKAMIDFITFLFFGSKGRTR